MLLAKLFCLDDCVERYEGYGKTLMDGVLLSNQFMGTHYNPNTRLLGDYGSSLYVVKRMRNKEEAGYGKASDGS